MNVSGAPLSTEAIFAKGAIATGLRCLILGAGGFIGSALIEALTREGAIVHGFDRITPDHVSLTAKWTKATLEDTGALEAAIRGQDIVFHLASSSLPATSNSNPAGDLIGSVVPTLALLDFCREAKVQKIVFASSGGTVYGSPKVIPTPESAETAPISAYGIGKLTIEHYLRLYHYLHGLDYSVLRIANPYGPGQSPLRKQGVIAVIMYRAMCGEGIEVWGDGEVTRDFVHVDDVASAFVAAALYRGNDRVLNIGTGIERSLNQIIADIGTTLGRSDLKIRRKPGRTLDVPRSALDISLSRRTLGWMPTIEWMDGLAETACWLEREFTGSNIQDGLESKEVATGALF